MNEEQRKRVYGALPAAYALAFRIGRRCRLKRDELRALAEDALIDCVERHDPAQGDLFHFAWKAIVFGVLRAAFGPASRPAAAAILAAILRHAEGEQPLSLSELMEQWEGDSERALSDFTGRLMGAAALSAATVTDSQGPEEAFGRRERWEDLKRVAGADGADPEAERVIELLYEQDASWKQVVTDLGVSPTQAKRIEARALDRLHAYLIGRKERK